MPSNMYICEPKTREDFRRYYHLRWKILRKPWNQPKGSEIDDDLEDKSIHLMICVENGRPIGVARLHFNNSEEAQIRYMAIDYDFQRKGVGTMLLKELERRAKNRGSRYIILNARENAVGFYKKNGYTIIGESYILFDTIHHFKMKKNL